MLTRHGSLDLPYRLGWLAGLALAALLGAALALNPTGTFDPPWLLVPLNLVFLTALPFVSSWWALTAYRATGVLPVLALGAGMLSIAVGGGIVPAVLNYTGGPNEIVTMHNSAVLLAGIGQFAAAVGIVMGYRIQRRDGSLAVAYGLVVAVLALLLVLVVLRLTPTFFVPGQGPTVLRQVVLGTATLLFVAAALIWWPIARANRAIPFLRWFVLGCAVFAVGLAAILGQSAVGGLVGWIGRLAQYLGVVFIGVGLIGVRRRDGEQGLAEAGLAIALVQATLPYRPLVESASDAVAALDSKGRVLYWNDAAVLMFGHARTRAFGRTLIELIVPTADQATGGQVLAAALAPGPGMVGPRRLTATLQGHDGQRLTGRIVAYGFPAEPDLVVCTIRDVTEHEAGEAARHETEERFRAAFEAVPDALAIVEAVRDETGEIEDFAFRWANATFRALYTADWADITGRRLYELVPTTIARKPIHVRVTQTGEPERVTVQVGTRWFEDVMSPFRDGFIYVSRDVTARIEAEAAREASAAMFEAVFMGSPIATSVSRLADGVFVEVNQATEEAFGRTRDELVGRSSLDLDAWVDPLERAAVAQILQRGEPVRNRAVRLRWKAGRIVDTLTSARTFDLHGTTHVAFQSIDVSELKRAEAALREAQRVGRTGSWTWDAGSDAPIWSDEMYRICGLVPEAGPLTRARLPEFLAPASVEAVRATFASALAGGGPFELELEFVRPDASRGCVLLRGAPQVPDDVAAGVAPGLHGTVTDISELRQAREAVDQSEARYRSLVEETPGVVYALSAQDGGLFYSSHVADILGYTPAELLVDPTLWNRLIHPDDLALVERAISGALAGESFAIEYRISDARGQWHWFEDRSMPNAAPGAEEAIQGFILDITARKQSDAERASLEAQLAQAQKLESIGRLAGGVAHDFNNMLNVILGNVEFALAQVEMGSRLATDLLEIESAARRSADLTRSLLAYARVQPVTPEVVDLNATVAASVALLERLIGEDVRLTFTPGPGLWSVRIDRSQLEGILANLAINARDAVTGVGSITILTANATLDAPGAAAIPDATPGDYVRLSVMDDGSGMPPEVLAHIFEPFYTTKPVGRGTGLGLSSVYGSLRQNGGFLTVASEPGRGSTFTLYLPRSGEPTDASAPGEIGSRNVGGKETILVVEDEPAVLRLAKRALEAHGYTVLAANGPGKALGLAAEPGRQIDLLLTDVVMPGQSGPELVAALLVTRPRLRYLYMSGQTDPGTVSPVAPEVGARLIHKPFATTDLAAAVRSKLDESQVEAP